MNLIKNICCQQGRSTFHFVKPILEMFAIVFPHTGISVRVVIEKLCSTEPQNIGNLNARIRHKSMSRSTDKNIVVSVASRLLQLLNRHYFKYLVKCT